MEHSYFQDRLSAYHDNELPLQEKVVVEEHLRDCPDCQRQLADYVRLDQLVIDHSQLADTDYWDTAARGIEKAIGMTDLSQIIPVSKVRERWALTWKLAAVAASAIIVAYLGINRDKILPLEKGAPPTVAPSVAQPSPDQGKDQLATDSVSSTKRDFDREEPRRNEANRPSEGRQAELQGGTAVKETQDKLSSKPADSRVRAEKVMPSGALADLKSDEKQSSVDRASAPAVEMPHTVPVAAPAFVPDSQLAQAEPKRSLDIQPETLANSLADKMPAKDTVGDIAYWRSLKDSLLASAERKDALGVNATKALTSQYQPSAKKPPSVAASAPAVNREIRLVEAWYRIARLTDNPAEKTTAIKALKVMTSGTAAAVHEKAGAYLDSLGQK